MGQGLLKLGTLALKRAVVKKVKRVTLLQWQQRYKGYVFTRADRSALVTL